MRIVGVLVHFRLFDPWSHFSRMRPLRSGLLALLATLLLSLVSWARAHNQLTKGTGNTARFELTLTWEDWAPAGASRKMILTNGQLPGPAMELCQGDDVEVMVVNNLPWGTTVHFHGVFLSLLCSWGS